VGVGGAFGSYKTESSSDYFVKLNSEGIQQFRGSGYLGKNFNPFNTTGQSHCGSITVDNNDVYLGFYASPNRTFMSFIDYQGLSSVNTPKKDVFVRNLMLLKDGISTKTR
jgi:hypothetical protein